MQLLQWFDAIDKDGNGQLTPMELQAALQLGHLNFSLATVAHIIRIHDKTGSGTISFDEFGKLHEFLTNVQQRWVHHWLTCCLFWCVSSNSSTPSTQWASAGTAECMLSPPWAWWLCEHAWPCQASCPKPGCTTTTHTDCADTLLCVMVCCPAALSSLTRTKPTPSTLTKSNAPCSMQVGQAPSACAVVSLSNQQFWGQLDCSSSSSCANGAVVMHEMQFCNSM
mgnify:CR=1 FL=1